jgi:phosphohistidine phosphatase SixA
MRMLPGEAMLFKAWVAAAAFLASCLSGFASEHGWTALGRGGVVAMFRHAAAPGVGDPAGFRLGECATQRNLSDEGRGQARRIGAAFRERQVDVQMVLSSRWCRALETGRLAFPEQVQEFAPLDSTFGKRDGQDRQAQAVRQQIAEWRGRRGVLVLISHQVNITAVTGIFPGDGEAVVLEPGPAGEIAVIGTIKP